ncbi:DUF484 family protein [Sphingomonas mesophila]|uniref:DUF484 family protein n=1 Tax=Sphingomonas mesophila TaxID=2303576 RepID=UPI0013C32854|nr:DUF484 family protein [Sphingomonas mesophila]
MVSFEDRAVARLRDRLGEAESARADLLAFARGHSAAVASIHSAVLHALGAESVEAMLDIAVRDWPELLEVDVAVVALVVGDQGFRVGRDGTSYLDPALVERAVRGAPGGLTRPVERGHALFGREAANVRAEAMVPIVAASDDCPRGLLLLGHRAAVAGGSAHGAALVEFLGEVLGAMLRRWLTTPQTPTPTPRAR